jgi:hypothetical protein
LAELFTILENFDAVFDKRGILFAITPSNRVIKCVHQESSDSWKADLQKKKKQSERSRENCLFISYQNHAGGSVRFVVFMPWDG